MKKKAFNSCRVFAMALAATVAGMATTSCEKEDDILPDEPKKEQVIPTKEVTLNLHESENFMLAGETFDAPKIFNTQYMDSLTSQPDVKNVKIKVAGRWDNAGTKTMHRCREALEVIVNIAPEKIKGVGDFVEAGVSRGTMSGTEQAVSDSLWFTSVGFTFLGQQ